MNDREQYDDEVEYGRVYAFDLSGDESDAQLSNVIWPHWAAGVPTKLSRKFVSPEFEIGPVKHRYRTYFETLEIEWSRSHLLHDLRRTDKNLMPSTRNERQWSGIYRVFLPRVVIHRFCGEDPTGTLYIGVAGTGAQSWSILQTRIKQLVKGQHHAVEGWRSHPEISKRYPWERLAVQWAFTGQRVDYMGQKILAAKLAETWLLRCYHESFGEYPPLNQKG